MNTDPARPTVRATRAVPAAEQDERGGDPACWLPRVCWQCGTMAESDPPTACPSCHALIPRED
jgi:rubrerythrin